MSVDRVYTMSGSFTFRESLILQPHLLSSEPEAVQAALMVTPSGSGLVPSPPIRPSHRPLHWRRHRPHQREQQPSHLRHRQRNQLNI
jgi:hypothetical protein